VLKSPSTQNPSVRPDEAAERARLVLASMVESGLITAEEAQAAVEAPASVRAADYIPAKQYVMDWIVEQLPQLVKGYDQSIVIETTIDPQLQFVSERILRNRLNQEGAKLGVSQAALVVLDGTGAVHALVGGKSYKRSQFNRVTKARRQPGSAFKPFLYLAALEQGFAPDSVEIDEPVRIGDWKPENYRQKYLGAVTLEKALALSLNTVAAKLVVKVTPASVAAVAHRLGITSELGNDASLALGTSEVTLLELTDAFVPFANGGYPVAPYVVKRISTRDGRIVYERAGSGFAQTITGFDLASLNRMMRAVVAYGTGKGARFANFDIAGKTGTSQDYRDAWFIGYTSDYVAGVWVGNDDNAPTLRVTGGSLPVAIWRDVMEHAHAGLQPRPLPGEPDLLAGIPPSQSDQDYVDGYIDPLQTRRNSGFFDSIGNLFGGEPRQARDKPRRKNLTAAERVKRAQEER
jgi:penicillin-binding protein 1A